MESKFLPQELFKTIVANTPLIATDLIIINDSNEILLGRRVNRPARNFWFVPGGRILKNEGIADTISRVWHSEVSRNTPAPKWHFFGLYEHRYPDNVFDDDSFDTYYLILAHILRVSSRLALSMDDQHEALSFWRLSDALVDPNVHEYTKIYLRQLINNTEEKL